LKEAIVAATEQVDLMMASVRKKPGLNSEGQCERTDVIDKQTESVMEAFKKAGCPRTVFEFWSIWQKDCPQRMILTLDIYCERDRAFEEHEAVDCPLALAYECEVVADGKDLDRPCSYILLPECVTDRRSQLSLHRR